MLIIHVQVQSLYRTQSFYRQYIYSFECLEDLPHCYVLLWFLFLFFWLYRFLCNGKKLRKDGTIDLANTNPFGIKEVYGETIYSTSKNSCLRTWLQTQWATKTVEEKGIGCMLPKNKRQKMKWHFDKEPYKKRCTVGCTLNRAQQNRRLATRYEKLPDMRWQCKQLMLW